MQPLLSVTVTLCDPAFNAVAVAVVSPLSHKYVFPPLPPAGVTVADPLLSPKHLTGLTWLALAVNNAGWLMVTDVVAEQPLLSVTVTLCDPAFNAVAVAVVSPLS